MARPEHYHQPALPLERSQRTEPIPTHQQPPTWAGRNPDGEAPIMSAIAADPEGLPRGLASHRLPNDFWQEFHLEWEFRERHGMTPVSPAEFADMRDFSDGVTVYRDIDQRPTPYERKKTE